MGLWQRLLKFIGLGPREGDDAPRTDLTYKVGWSSRDKAFRSEVLELPDVVGLGETPQDALSAAESAVPAARSRQERAGVPILRSPRVRGFHTRVSVFLLPPPREEDP